MERLLSLTQAQLESRTLPSVQPHHTMLYPLPDPLPKDIAAAYARASQKKAGTLGLPPFTFEYVRGSPAFFVYSPFVRRVYYPISS